MPLWRGSMPLSYNINMSIKDIHLRDISEIFTMLLLFLHYQSSTLFAGGGRVVRWCWVNFQCRGALQFGLQ